MVTNQGSNHFLSHFPPRTFPLKYIRTPRLAEQPLPMGGDAQLHYLKESEARGDGDRSSLWMWSALPLLGFDIDLWEPNQRT